MSPTKLSGYGALFNQETVILNAFREVIRPGAFAETIRRDDVRSLFNHDVNMVLGRKSATSLTLAEDARGLRYTVTINEADAQAQSIVARILRGDVSGSSFWFAIDPRDEEWQAGSRGQLPLRILHRLTLIDTGPVTFPAYPMTTATVLRNVPAAIAQRQALRAAINGAKAVQR
jgi:HK97 family phage prohead protease